MLAGKVAVVTGSTTGIGLGIARVLAGSGANVMLNGFGDHNEIEKLRRSLASEFNIKVSYHGADMSKPKEIKDLIDTTISNFGKVDILVNNAGIQHTAEIEKFPEDKWESIISINLSSAFYTTKYSLPSMKASGWGRIINIASVHGLVGSVQKSAYVAAKHGVVGLTKVTALETAQTKITCNAICPGWVLTPLVEKQIKDRAAQNNQSIENATRSLLAEKQPTQRFTTTEEIGQVVKFLCSESSGNITGVSLPVDGAWTAL